MGNKQSEAEQTTIDFYRKTRGEIENKVSSYTKEQLLLAVDRLSIEQLAERLIYLCNDQNTSYSKIVEEINKGTQEFSKPVVERNRSNIDQYYLDLLQKMERSLYTEFYLKTLDKTLGINPRINDTLLQKIYANFSKASEKSIIVERYLRSS